MSTRYEDTEDMDDIEGMGDEDADDCDIDHGDADDADADDEEFTELSEDELGDVLQDALELYAQEHGLPDPRICSFRDAGYLTMNSGLVVRMGGVTFDLTIVRHS